MTKPVNHVLEFGPFRLETAERLLLREGKAVSLTPKAFSTLLILVQNRGRLVEKDDLMKQVWPERLSRRRTSRETSGPSARPLETVTTGTSISRRFPRSAIGLWHP